MSPKWWVLVSVACGTFMATLDSSIVNIALPTLTKDLSSQLAEVKWVVMIHLLTITCLLLPIGKVADLFGRKRVFMNGFLVFTAGSMLCGFAGSVLTLSLARVFQGVGAAMLMANGPAIITSAFPKNELGKALGTMAMVTSMGLISGPTIGGMVVSAIGWRSIFFLNIPVGILGAYLVWKNLAEDELPEDFLKKRAEFDWRGTLLSTLIVCLFLFSFDPPDVLMSGGNPFSIARGALLLVMVGLFFVFLSIEKKSYSPLLDLTLLKNRTFLLGNLALFFNFIAFSCVSVLMPFFLEEVLEMQPHRAGLYMSAIPLTVLITAPISGRLSDKFGTKGLTLLGAFILAIGLFGMAGIFGFGIEKEMNPTLILCLLSSIGLATGLFQSPNNTAIMKCVPTRRLGSASALLATIRNLGLVTGAGIATALFTWRLTATHNYVHSLHVTYFFGGIVALFAVISSFFRKSDRENAHVF